MPGMPWLWEVTRWRYPEVSVCRHAVLRLDMFGPFWSGLKTKMVEDSVEDLRYLKCLNHFEPWRPWCDLLFDWWFWEHIQVKVFGLWLHPTFIVGHPDTSHANRSTWGTKKWYHCLQIFQIFQAPAFDSRCIPLRFVPWHRLRSAQVRANFLQCSPYLTTLRCPVHMGAELPFYFLFISKSRAYAL